MAALDRLARLHAETTQASRLVKFLRSAETAALRRRQLVSWTRALVRARLLARLEDPPVRLVVERYEADVLDGTASPEQAAIAIIAAVDGPVVGR